MSGKRKSKTAKKRSPDGKTSDDAKTETPGGPGKVFDFGGLPDRDLKKNLGGCG